MKMTIEGWLKSVQGLIPRLDAELILLTALKEMLPPGVDRSFLVAHPDVGISRQSWEELDKLAARRANGEPLAYILGYREFYGRDFVVSPEVLIPRPETEQLIELTLGANLPEKARILEIGTGSGCIAITLSLEHPDWTVVATDISKGALEMARENNHQLGAKVQFLEADLFQLVSEGGFKNEVRLDQGLGVNGVKTAKNSLLGQKFDFLVANLPYVDPSWEWLKKQDLSYEPALALYVAEEEGLGLYRRLFEQLQRQIPQMALECDPCQREKLIQMAAEFDYKVVAQMEYATLLTIY